MVLFLLSCVSVFALYCPNCGTHNKVHWRHCVGCGESLEEARKLLNSRNQQPKDVKNREIKTLYLRGDKTEKAKIYRGTPGLKASKSKKNRDSASRYKGMTPQQIQQLIQGNTAQHLLKFQNQSISEGQLSAFQSNPQIQQLVNQMKSRQFQGQLMQGLREMQKNIKGSQGQKMQGQLQQLQGLFELLNQQSILMQDSYQP